jgi:hypothetical protein
MYSCSFNEAIWFYSILCSVCRILIMPVLQLLGHFVDKVMKGVT